MPALRRLEPKYRHCFVQVPHLVRKQLAESLRIDKSAIRVSASDVGGGFGMKLGAFPEDVLACLHAMVPRRLVKWIEDRMEHFRASTHGRKRVSFEWRHAVSITRRASIAKQRRGDYLR